MHNKNSTFLCFASFCAHLCVLSNKFNCNDARVLGNETTNLQTPSFKYASWRAKIAGGVVSKIHTRCK